MAETVYPLERVKNPGASAGVPGFGFVLDELPESFIPVRVSVTLGVVGFGVYVHGAGDRLVFVPVVDLETGSDHVPGSVYMGYAHSGPRAWRVGALVADRLGVEVVSL